MKRIALLAAFLCILIPAWSQKKKADLLVHNARIYTADSLFTVAQAMVITNGTISAVGTEAALLGGYDPKQKLDAGGKAVYPGFIDAHAHFAGYGFSLGQVDLTGTQSWAEVLARASSFLNSRKPAKGEWILGRGWDQNDWMVKEFPDKAALDKLFPDNPVLLTRVDGHAAIANGAALKAAGIQSAVTIEGGTVEMRDGRLTGILIDNAVRLISSRIPPPTAAQARTALLAAEKNCFATGLTTVADCGLDWPVIEGIDSLQKRGELRMRIYALLSDNGANLAWALLHGPYHSDRLSVRGFKMYADGALGSRGAALLHPYHDRKDWSGFLLSSPAHFDSMARVLYDNNWQLCTHAIGDSGNRTILNIYGKYLRGPNDRRWRIEHVQVVAPEDFNLFGKYSIIPSVQPTHATSDMYWAGDRLGAERLKSAYAYRQLLNENGWLPLGTDFPVEDISPFKTFYAAVARQDAKGYPTGGFQPENALTRQQAIWGMTLWAAKAQFEEGEKGSLEPGKRADFVILDRDLMKVELNQILSTRVLSTYVGGSAVFRR